MRLGTNKKLISSNCFRLLELVREVQNDVEIVKPVLEELEVIRLSCSLGMLSSISANDFEVEMLAAEEFDDDFALFLRMELFGENERAKTDGVNLISLFGKQEAVRFEFMRRGGWSDDMESHLKTGDHGIYCVAQQENSRMSLTLFSWIPDNFFQKSRLRDTATYVLRFLTCLCPNMVCCLSVDDVELLDRAVKSMKTTNLDAWRSYSVAFHVERQEEQKDGVICEELATVSLPVNSPTGKPQLLKGSYPAYSVVEPAPATKRTIVEHRTFGNMKDFASWLIEEAHQRTVQIDWMGLVPKSFRQVLLETAEQLPIVELKNVREMVERSRQTLVKQASEEVQMLIEEYRAALIDHAEKLFDLDVLFKVVKGEPAFVTLNHFVRDMKSQRSIWNDLDQTTQMTLTFPCRLKKQIKSIASMFRDHGNDDESDTFLATFMSQHITGDEAIAEASSDGIFKRTLKHLGKIITQDQDPVLLSDEFRMSIKKPLTLARETWFSSVEKVLKVAETALVKKYCDDNERSLQQVHQDDEHKVICDAFEKLLFSWRTQHEDNLTTTIRPRFRFSMIYCNLEKEHWEPATDQLKIIKLTHSDGERFEAIKLGTHRLPRGEKVLKSFSIKNHCIVLVTTSPNGTTVSRVNFPLQRRSHEWEVGVVMSERHFGRSASLCDLNVKERLIAFVEEGGRVVLYRFNETFSKLELYKQIELSLRTSLKLPVTDVLLADEFFYATDSEGLIQSVNIRNQQSSRATLIQTSGPDTHSLFASADSSVLCFLGSKGRTNSAEDSYCAELYAVASEDFRNVPVTFIGDVVPRSKALLGQIFNDLLLIVNEERTVCVYRLAVTVRSESFQIQHSKEHSVNGSKTNASGGNDTDHWLRVFYHTYEKFPVRGLIQGVDDTRSTIKLQITSIADMTEQDKDSCLSFFQNLMRDLRKLNKPLCGMDLARNLAFVTDVLRVHIAPQPAREFVLNLITFVPIQICRAEANSLTVMTNGKANSINSQAQKLHAVDIARSIRFGLISPLLESWQGRCVVITSMGKQSTGKSYLLNHLTGSSFAIAGARCTDGAWMSIRILPNQVLLVVLDFEGLGSFERTEQEDVFLSVLNASISMFTIFRMEMRFDKEIDDLFARFQKGVALIKGDPTLFRGKLYMSVKDVNPNDQKGVLDEFFVKFQKLVGANKDSNFLLDMYSGQLDINCSPPLGTVSYYQSLMHAQNYIEMSLCGVNNVGFRSGKTFLDCIRLVLAKITILDWTSLDESAKQFQLSEITSKLSGLLRTGCLIPQEYVQRNEDAPSYLKEKIAETGNGEVINVDVKTLCDEYLALGEKWKRLNNSIDLDLINDWDIDLGFDCCSSEDNTISEVHTAIKQLLRIFLRSNTSIQGGKVPRGVEVDFDAFLSFFVRRRKARISIYVKQILGDRMPEEWTNIEQQFLGRFQILFSRCQSHCNECHLGCMKAAAHLEPAHHSCGGNHICGGRCEYCDSSENCGKTPPCDKEAGHEGKCECRDGDHTCGRKCCMDRSPNCGRKCSLKRGHLDLHKCDVVVHTCGQKCSAKGCSGRCILDVENSHTAHKCGEERCMQECVMDGCNEVCGVLDHFHGQEDVSVVFSVENSDEKESRTFDAVSETPIVHMCTNGHECQSMCQENGICKVDVFLKKSSKTFTGDRGSFQFNFQEMNGARKKCTKLLSSGQMIHQGPHSCICAQNDQVKKDVIHYCDVRCPCCSYFCQKSYGHHGAHTTSHGNMRNTFFLSDTQDIDIEERKYKTGELGIAEMCNLYCSKMGREHVHYLECEQSSEAQCIYSGSASDQRRHCKRALEPKPDKEMDEVLHKKFWEHLGWEDPCTSKMELELFGKCGYKCDAPDHDDQPSYCVLPAWHNALPKSTSGFDGFTYVKGHKFECSHLASGGKMHHVFVLDCSGSMQGQPWSDLMGAWKEYVYNRISGGSTSDLVSVVTFDNSAQIVYEAQYITMMQNVNIPYRGGGTNYAVGLRCANEVLSRVNFEEFKPAIVFFSDGHPIDPLEGERLAMHIKGCYERNGLQAFAVGFGSINLNMLERVAEKLGGTYHHVLTGNELKTTFFTISASLSTRVGLALAKPDHERNCVICGQDLASGETVKLETCKHELHKVCLDVLERNAKQDSEVAHCPSCRREISFQKA
ncbi:hypothetical protein F444_21954 [Plasmopara halstedii]|uniref:VWFA domain-containing protein n=1 Tax=Plasmopara halstedii TaxID=4781 RepID=A0A0P1B170_PLAHL|nr:hypothetical protein F444_21954 [Plasmopara halstedii]CEG48495.1 hypothetical protein F444_21954 [Plasmopara halstedii]|eukprot:XP_024584864.1 hypothetical protein F444_21954 [Plasmopara halstedii]